MCKIRYLLIYSYKLNPDADLSVYDHHALKKDEEPKKPKKNLGFTCVLVEKYV